MTCFRATTLFCLYFNCKDSGFFVYVGCNNCFLGCKFCFYSINKTTPSTSSLFFTPIQIPLFLSFQYSSYRKPGMDTEGSQETIMGFHHLETLLQRCLVILAGHSAIQEIRQHRMHIAQR